MIVNRDLERPHNFLDLQIIFSCSYSKFYFFQVIDPETLRENPILFGDFLSVTTEREDRLYEEFTDIRKIQSNLQEVRKIGNLTFLEKCGLLSTISIYFVTHCRRNIFPFDNLV